MKASDILSLQDLRTKKVKVKAWKCELIVREMGLDDAVSWFAMASNEKDGKLTLTGEEVAQVVARGVIDESGERVFSDDDIPALAKKSKKALMQLYQEIVGLSGDDAVKN